MKRFGLTLGLFGLLLLVIVGWMNRPVANLQTVQPGSASVFAERQHS